MLVWRSANPSQPEVPYVTFSAEFTPIHGNTARLSFNFADLLTAGQYASLPDPVFPVAMKGANYYVAKWSPVNPYQFKRLTIYVANNNSQPIVIDSGIIIYYVYSESKQPPEVIPEIFDFVIE